MPLSSDSVWSQIAHNRVIFVSVAAWAAAQSLKVLLGVIRERRFNFKWFVGSGGMPSSHAAFVTASTVCVGITYGFDSVIFAACLVFSFIILFDAQGVRRQSGRQAGALNHILDDVYAQRGLKLEPVMELLGHTPVEVLAGACIGTLFAVGFMKNGGVN